MARTCPPDRLLRRHRDRLEVAGHLDALVLPLCPLGVTPMHMPYPGTVSLRPSTLQDVVADIGSSLAAHGAGSS